MLKLSSLNYIDTFRITLLLKFWFTLFFLKDYTLEALLKLGPEYLGQFISVTHINLLIFRDRYVIGMKIMEVEKELGKKSQRACFKEILHRRDF